MTSSASERYLRLFEDAVNRQAALVGSETAREQARKAGLILSHDGTVESCTADPMVTLLRLIRYFTADGNFVALEHCTPLITHLLEASARIGADEPTPSGTV